jgi:hypothetical protein
MFVPDGANPPWFWLVLAFASLGIAVGAAVHVGVQERPTWRANPARDVPDVGNR